MSVLRLRAALLILAAVAGPAELAAQRRIWQPDTRVLVSDGSLLTAVAVSPRAVFGAAPGSIVVFDLVRSRWDLPLPYPLEATLSRPTALAWDPAAGALWLGTESGDVFTTVPGFAQWDRVPVIARGRVDAIVASPRDAAMFFRAGGEWQRVRSGSLIADVVPAVPPAVAAAAEAPADPFFRSAMGTLRLDPAGYLWSLTDVERGDAPGEYWIATSGGGLQRFDSRTSRREWFRFGLNSNGAGSIAVLSGRLWFGGDGRSQRMGIARSTADLADWQQYDASRGAPRGFVAEIVEFAGATWFASSDGLYRLEPGADERSSWTRLAARSGLTSDRVRCLRVAGGLLWVGTEQGLSAFDSTSHRAIGSLLPGRRISRLGSRGDTLLVASEDGLWTIPLAAGASTPLPGSFRRPLADLLVDNDIVWVIAHEQLYQIDRASAPERDAALERIGTPLRLAMQDGRLWVAGVRGIAHRDPVTGGWEAFTTPADIPAGPVVDVLPAGDEVWAATPVGAVRLRWR